jgi:hypothetical protein
MAGLLAALSLFAGISLSTTPVRQKSIPPNVIRLLDALAREGEVEVADVLGELPVKEFGDESRIGVILGEAVRQGRINEGDVRRGFEKAGCGYEQPKSQQCRLAVQGFKASAAASGVYAKSMTIGSVGPELETLRGRAELNESGTSASNDLDRRAYVNALVAESSQPMRTALGLFVAESTESAWAQVNDPSDRRVLRLMTSYPGSGKTDFEPSRLRRAAGSAFRTRIVNSRGDLEIVREVRELPETLIKQAFRIDASYVDSLLEAEAGSIGCIINSWRQGAEQPGRWLAWKMLVQCYGW